MSPNYFLLVIGIVILTLSVVSADDNGKTCPYYGKRNQTSLDTVNSKEFQKKLDAFGLLFLKNIPSADFFFKLFDISFDSKTVQRTFFLNCVYYGVNMGLNCPIKLCKEVARKADGAFKKNITIPDYFIVIVNTLKDSLKAEGKLNSMDENATSEKIKKFFNDVAEYLCKPDVMGAIEALFALNDGGAIKFFKSVGEIDKREAAAIAKRFGNEFANVGQPSTKPTESPDLLELKIKLLGLDIKIPSLII